MDTGSIKNTLLNFLIPLICLGASILLFLLVVYPSFTKVPELKDKLAKAKTLNAQLDAKLVKLNNYQDFKSVLEENSALVDRAMPAEQNIPGILDQVDQIARESGLEVSKLSYSLNDTSNKNGPQLDYNAVIVSLGADGTYEQMINFMKTAENAARVVSISNFRFTATSSKGIEKLSFTFIVQAPYMMVQSNAVTDEPLKLDITSGDFISFINRVKGLRYFERSGDEMLKVIAEEIEDIDTELEDPEPIPVVVETTPEVEPQLQGL